MPKTCQCAVCGVRRADVATLLGQFVCFDCLIGAAADAVDASEGPRSPMSDEQVNCLEERLGVDVAPNPEGTDDDAELVSEWADGLRTLYPNVFRS